jgi:hypothetical protein
MLAESSNFALVFLYSIIHSSSEIFRSRTIVENVFSGINVRDAS